MIKILAAIITLLLLLTWVVWVGGIIYFLFRITLLKFQQTERTDERQKLKKYGLGLVFWFFGFLLLQMGLAQILKFLR